MSLSSANVTKVNRMNRAAQDASLGDRIRMVKFSETIAYTDFTDSTGVTGTYVMTEGSIPVGATVLFASCEAITGFAGDTSATIQIGDGTDADRYSTGTPSVFTTAAGGIALGVPSGVQYHAVAKDVTVTVTAATDWGGVTAGSVTISLYYLD
jgi:hypothetical protein